AVDDAHGRRSQPEENDDADAADLHLHVRFFSRGLDGLLAGQQYADHRAAVLDQSHREINCLGRGRVMDFVETEGDTIDAAIDKALKLLGVARDRITVDIIAEGRRGILGFGAQKARVRAELRKSALERIETAGAIEAETAAAEAPAADINHAAIAARAEAALREILRLMGIRATVTQSASANGEETVLEIRAEDSGLLIGRKGQTLEALQYLVTRIAGERLAGDGPHLVIDIEKYRERRRKSLEDMALRLAEKDHHRRCSERGRSPGNPCRFAGRSLAFDQKPRPGFLSPAADHSRRRSEEAGRKRCGARRRTAGRAAQRQSAGPRRIRRRRRLAPWSSFVPLLTRCRRFSMIESVIARRKTRQIQLGAVKVGGDAPITVQSMTKTDTRDVRATVQQIWALEAAGCEIIRCAVPVREAAEKLGEIKKKIRIPLVADIHFNYKLALIAIEQGVDGLRLNPGNIGARKYVEEVVRAASERKIPIRIGVNAGSLEKDLLQKHNGPTAEGMVESGLRHIRILEDCG